jgi:hypothetical protein
LEKEKSVLGKEKGALRSDKINCFGTNFEAYKVFYYEAEGVKSTATKKIFCETFPNFFRGGQH